MCYILACIHVCTNIYTYIHTECTIYIVVLWYSTTMVQQPIIRCISIFKFIFIEHVFKGKSIKSVIKRIKIKDKFPQCPHKNSARVSSDEEVFLIPLEKTQQNIVTPLESNSNMLLWENFQFLHQNDKYNIYSINIIMYNKQLQL